MAYTTINKSVDYFNTKLYTGNGSTQSITGVGFQPDMTWVKSRTTGGSTNNNHCINDVVRTKGTYGYPMIHPNLDATEYDPTSGNEVITDFQSDGFDLGGNENSNYNTATYASWNWKANGAGSANTDGSISSTVSASATSGFSIVKWTGTGSSGTIGHGLGVAPKVVIVKRYTSTSDWVYYTSTIDGSMDYLYLNLTNAKVDSGNPVPTSSVFQKNDTNGETQIAYCFAEKTGYSKFGSYTGNGSANGTFVYTGFKPAFVIHKRTDATSNWTMHDSTRSLINTADERLYSNLSNAEDSGGDYGDDILSNGFKIRTTSSSWNASGGTYIYMAFAEAPLVGTNNVPCTAR